MILQSYWKGVSDEWLCGRTARLFFGAAATSIVAMTAALLWAIPSNPGVFANICFGIVGVAGALSIFFLWSGMWRYWTRCDSSSKRLRHLSFVLLLFGACYGAIVYYLSVYLPKTAAAAGLPLRISAADSSNGPRTARAMKIFRAVVIAGWLGLGVLGASVFLQFTSLLEFIANHHGLILIFLYMIGVLIATALYKIIATYKAGMGRDRRRA